MSWIIEGACKVIADNFKPKPPQVVCETIAAYQEDNDWLSVFLNDVCEMNPLYKQESGILYMAFRDYCINMQEHIRSTKDFYAALEQKGYHKTRNNKGSFIYGLMLKKDVHINDIDFGT